MSVGQSLFWPAGMSVCCAFALGAQIQERCSIETGLEPCIVAVSPDGSVIAASGRDSLGSRAKAMPASPGDGPKVRVWKSHMDLQLWDALTGQRLFRLKELRVGGRVLQEYRFGKYIYRLIQIEAQLEDLGTITAITFSPDGLALAWGHLGRVTWWNGRTGYLGHLSSGGTGIGDRGSKVRVSVSPNGCDWLAFSSDGRSLAAAGPSYEFVGLWDVSTAKERILWKAIPSGGVAHLAFLPNSQMLAVLPISKDQPIPLWDVTTGQVTASFSPQPEPAHAIAFSRDGRTFVSAARAIKIWNLSSRKKMNWKETGTLPGHEKDINCLVFAQERLLISGGQEGCVKLWDVRQQKELASHNAHPERASYSSLSPIDNQMRQSSGVSSLAVSADGGTLISAGANGVVKVWDVRVMAGNPQAKRQDR